MSVFANTLHSGCEPSLGDIGCIDDDEPDEAIPEHVNRLIQVEDFDLKLRPSELDQMVIDLSVNKSEKEMRQAEKEYKRLQYSKKSNTSEVSVQPSAVYVDFGVVPSEKVRLTKGDCIDIINPETF